MQSSPSLFDPDVLERQVLERWEREQTFAESLRRREGAPRYTVYDGPPYATGSPHYGHILQTTIKDTVTRYWTMRGFRVDRRVGWDCHGLPVEHLVEKELGVKNKKEIEAMGVETFNAACRAAVFRSVDEFTRVLKRVGRWADYTNAYATLDWTYMESVWWVFKQLWDAGCVTHGFRSSPYCPRCETPLSNFETAQGYKDTDDPAVTVKLKVADHEATYLLIWTTTPWTLPANVAVAVHPDLRYVTVKVGDERWIIAKDRLSFVVDLEYTLEEEYAGTQLVGRRYEPLYDFVVPDKEAYRVIAAPFVRAAEGTGIVHIAPAFGEDDLNVAQAEDLPLLRTVDSAGRFIADVKPWAGMFVKDVDSKIIRDLEARGLLVRNETIRHPYPFCWRCDTPLIYSATHSWFVTVSKFHAELLANNAQIQWVPEHLKEGRFGQGLRDAPDWAISRSRFWGTPLPVWQCEACGSTTAVGSLQELTARGADLSVLSPNGKTESLDLHRPYVDAVVFPCSQCGEPTRRVPEVFDVWMDAGSMPYAQWHYPFEHKKLVEETFPAHFIAEALDQTRGWFYTLHVLATILTHTDRGLGVGKPAFTHAITSGFVLGEDGRKLSKRYGNFAPVDEVVRRYGADTLRLFLLASQSIGEDYRISDRLIATFYRHTTLPLVNVLTFYETYAGAVGRVPGEATVAIPDRPLLDRWILARTGALVRDVRREMDGYHPDRAARALIGFVEDLSNWYVRRSRKRFVGNASLDRDAAFATLEDVLAYFSLVSAPCMPFFADAMYRRVRTDRSPHLEDFPDVREQDDNLLDAMSAARDVVSVALQLRALAGIKVRQPLETLVVVGTPPVDLQSLEWQEVIRGEVNVKAVEVRAERPRGLFAWYEMANGVAVGLRTDLTPELREEGIVRDLIRHVQDLRKRAGLTVHDTIELAIASDRGDLRTAIEKHTARICRDTRARGIRSELPARDAEETVRIDGGEVRIQVVRVSEDPRRAAAVDSG